MVGDNSEFRRVEEGGCAVCAKREGVEVGGAGALWCFY